MHNLTTRDFYAKILCKYLRGLRGQPKPSLKIETENAICWHYRVLFRDHGLRSYFFVN